MCDCEYPQVYNQEWRKARKRHKCCRCGGRIEPGEVYEYVCGLWDGWDFFKTCAVCEEIICAIIMDTGCHCVDDDFLVEYLCEYWSPITAIYLGNMQERGAELPLWALERLNEHCDFQTTTQSTDKQ